MMLQKILLTCFLLTYTRYAWCDETVPKAVAHAAEGIDAADQLDRLAQELRDAGNQDAADTVARWNIARPTDRQVLFLTTQRQLSDADSGAFEPWMEAFLNIREERAQALWQQASAHLEQQDLAGAIQSVHAILREHPADARAQRMLRSHIYDPLDVRSKQARGKQRQLGWKSGDYFVVTSPHFVISTNHSEAEGRRLANLLEETYHLWAQVFVRCWTDIGAVRRAFADRSLPSPSRSRHRVVLFANRDDYINHLRPQEPQIALSKGIYRPNSRTAYFYAEEALEPYWRHEIVHQLLAETGAAARIDEMPGEKSHAWLVEAIAIYFESIRQVNDHYEIGGFESPRLQYARYRMLQEQFFIPGEELAAIGREALKSDPQIRKIYTQSAGLAHFYMDAGGGERRSQLVELVRQMYQEPRAAERSRLLVSDFASQLEDGYRQFLNVDDQQAAHFSMPDTRSLCLGRTQITDRVASAIGNMPRLEWLDLAACDVGDSVVAAIPGEAPLAQLNLQGTRITDASLPKIARFEHLEELDLSNTAVTDDGVAHLSKLANLKLLWLSGTRVTEAGASPLRDLPNLRKLDIPQTEAANRVDGVRDR